MTGGIALLRRPPVVDGAIGWVELTQGQVAIFDAEDMRLVVGRSWCATRVHTECGFYATAWDPELGRNLEMHRLLMGRPKAHFVDHIDGNGLDNRRANLRLCTPSENLRNRIARKPAGASSTWACQRPDSPNPLPIRVLDLQLPDARRTRHQPREDLRMTSTEKLPDHNGEPVRKSQMKFTGVGTGFNGLDVAPIFMDLDDVGYFVMKATATESPSARRDNNEQLFWLNRLGVESVAPIPQEIAEKALQQYAQQIERLKEEAEGKQSLFAEQEAEAREALDETGTPEEIAAAAGERAKQKP